MRKIEYFIRSMLRWMTLRGKKKVASLDGYVTDKDTGDALEAVKVTIDNQIAHTNSDGYYKFTGLSVGNHQVIFEKEGYGTVTK